MSRGFNHKLQITNYKFAWLVLPYYEIDPSVDNLAYLP
jgi:hypothetical protein